MLFLFFFFKVKSGPKKFYNFLGALFKFIKKVL